MLDLSTLGTFVAVVLGLFLIPGPAVLLVLTRTVHGGRKAGILTGLGIAVGEGCTLASGWFVRRFGGGSIAAVGRFLGRLG